jgi:hypothetical protein
MGIESKLTCHHDFAAKFNSVALPERERGIFFSKLEYRNRDDDTKRWKSRIHSSQPALMTILMTEFPRKWPEDSWGEGLLSPEPRGGRGGHDDWWGWGGRG